MFRGVKKQGSTSFSLGVLTANPANVPWIANDTKRVTVMSVENISVQKREVEAGEVNAATKSGRGLKGSHYSCHT